MTLSPEARRTIEQALWRAGITGDACARVAFEVEAALADDGFVVVRAGGAVTDDEWQFFDVEETPASGHKEAWEALVQERPELASVAEWDRRVDVVCGRDGVSRHRFAVRTSPTPEPPRRLLP